MATADGVFDLLVAGAKSQMKPFEDYDLDRLHMRLTFTAVMTLDDAAVFQLGFTFAEFVGLEVVLEPDGQAIRLYHPDDDVFEILRAADWFHAEKHRERFGMTPQLIPIP